MLIRPVVLVDMPDIVKCITVFNDVYASSSYLDLLMSPIHEQNKKHEEEETKDKGVEIGLSNQTRVYSLLKINKTKILLRDEESVD